MQLLTNQQERIFAATNRGRVLITSIIASTEARYCVAQLYYCRLMLLACHKKSYLMCDEITNFRIFTQPIPIFFSKYKTETANRGQRQLLENK